MFFIRGLTEENTRLGIISPIGYFRSPIGDMLSNLELVTFSVTLRFQTQMFPIPNGIYYPKLGISYSQLGIICPIGDIVCYFSITHASIYEYHRTNEYIPLHLRLGERHNYHVSKVYHFHGPLNKIS